MAAVVVQQGGRSLMQSGGQQQRWGKLVIPAQQESWSLLSLPFVTNLPPPPALLHGEISWQSRAAKGKENTKPAKITTTHTLAATLPASALHLDHVTWGGQGQLHAGAVSPRHWRSCDPGWLGPTVPAPSHHWQGREKRDTRCMALLSSVLASTVDTQQWIRKIQGEAPHCHSSPLPPAPHISEMQGHMTCPSAGGVKGHVLLHSVIWGAEEEGQTHCPSPFPPPLLGPQEEDKGTKPWGRGRCQNSRGCTVHRPALVWCSRFKGNSVEFLFWENPTASCWCSDITSGFALEVLVWHWNNGNWLFPFCSCNSRNSGAWGKKPWAL